MTPSRTTAALSVLVIVDVTEANPCNSSQKLKEQATQSGLHNLNILAQGLTQPTVDSCNTFYYDQFVWSGYII